MSQLDPAAQLERSRDLRVRIRADRTTTVVLAGQSIAAGEHGLAILDAFARPCSIREALEKLRPRVKGAQAWLDLTAAIMRLWDAGVLCRADGRRPTLRRGGQGYGDAPVHIMMLNDRSRTDAFLAGIREVVQPGDVVVDIGTGTGILAIAAARAGASRVYAVEASSIGHVAAANFEANGVSDRVTLLPGWSTDVDLPEPADVLVSETVGHDPLGERIVEVTADAVKRFLKPNVRLIPARIRVLGLPVAVPMDRLAQHTITPTVLANWQEWYGVDFGPMLEADRRSPASFNVDPRDARDWPALAAPVVLADLGLGSLGWPQVHSTADVVAHSPGDLRGVLTFFEIELGPTTRLSTDPQHVSEDNHWRSPVWVVPDPLALRKGDRFQITYTRNVAEAPDGVRVTLAAGEDKADARN